ncbi:DNA-binding protein [Dyella soli]|uniref:DNA-binding protein n=1 Tax=Dyella soli TaxID=522319 RepID=A0A4R0Z0I1_9GAMM|nr:DNA-binding protein [Dyella soli]
MFDIDDLSALLHRPQHTIRNDASRAPHRLPPRCVLPGQRRLLWRKDDVMAWLAAAVVPSMPEQAQSPQQLPRRRGRPPKANPARGRSEVRHG